MREGLGKRYGPWALVAGGSEGLGAAFASELATAGLNLVLVARRRELLERSAADLRARCGVEARPISLDLSSPAFMRELVERTEDLEIGLLVCDAAHAHTGRFLEAGPDEYARIIDTNCRAPLALIHHFAGAMARRGRGGIIVMSSLSAFWGSPYVAVYGATKAFLLNLSEALWKELGDKGIDVTACAAGPVLTPNYIASKPPGAGPSALEMSPAGVARAALAGLGRKTVVVPGALNRAARLFMYRFLPRRAAVKTLAASTGAMYAETAGRREDRGR